jgi:hypothetical protein
MAYKTSKVAVPCWRLRFFQILGGQALDAELGLYRPSCLR